MNVPALRRFGAAAVVSVLCFSFVAVAAAEDVPAQPLHHGSRAKAGDGTMVVYDAVNEIFVVPSQKDTYWVEQRFYHYDGGTWSSAKELAGPWTLVPFHEVPEVAQRHFAPLKSSATARLPSGHEAVYEPRIKAYRVAGKKGLFLFDARFYRYDGGVWLDSDKEDGPWKPATMKALPMVLRKAVPAPEAGQTVTLPSGEEIVYDADEKFFSLKDKPDTMFFDGSFYEKRGQKWFASPETPGRFAEVELAKVPGLLRMKFRKEGADKKNRQKGEGKQRNRDKQAGDHPRRNQNADKPRRDQKERPAHQRAQQQKNRDKREKKQLADKPGARAKKTTSTTEQDEEK